MSVVESPILADDSGRRRRRLRVVGRLISMLLVAWLGVLALGALGLQPLGRLPLVNLVPDRATPTPLPARVQAAVRTHQTVVAGPTAAVDMPPIRAWKLRVPVLSVGRPTVGTRRVLGGTRPVTTRRPAARHRASGSPTTSSRSTGSPGSTSTQTTATAPPPSSTGTGTTPAPAPTPTAPGHSGTAPGQTTPVTPPRGKPTDPKALGIGRTTSTTPRG